MEVKLIDKKICTNCPPKTLNSYNQSQIMSDTSAPDIHANTEHYSFLTFCFKHSISLLLKCIFI